MILGIGTDLVEIDRIRAVLDAHGERFRRRLLAPPEWRAFTDAEIETAFLARRWAAKEAIAKAFGTGIGAELSFQDIVIDHDPAGRPEVKLLGRGADLAARRGIRSVHLSLSDERRLALAFAVLES